MNISQILEQLISLAKQDALKAALPALATFLTSISTNPTGPNIVAQLAKLQIDLMASLPGIETDILKQLAATIESEAQLLLTKLAA